MEPAASTNLVWPSTPAWPVIGHMRDMISLGGLIPYLESAWRQLGDCFEFRVAGEVIKIVVHPDDIEALLVRKKHKYIKGDSYDQFRRVVGLGLITSEGDLWLTERKIVQPCFRRETIHNMASRMVAQADLMLDRWARTLTDGQAFDVHHEMMRLTLEIIAETLFGLHFREDEQAFSTQAFTDAISVVVARVTAIAEAPRWMPTPGNIRYERAIAALDHVVLDVIEQRRRDSEDRDDLLGALLRARDEDGNPVDEVQLRDEVVTMFLAGHETTAVALGWTLWQLAQNPEIRARMTAEIDAAIGQRPPTIEDLPALGYVRQVFCEGMRRIPPVWATARNCIEPDTLGSGYPVEVGMRVMNLTWLTHKHQDFWPDPDRFDPDRFLPEAIADRHKYAYLPFNVGPRRCVGEHFAMIESILVLTRMFQRFDLEAAPGFVPEIDHQLTTRPRHGLMMRLRERT